MKKANLFCQLSHFSTAVSAIRMPMIFIDGQSALNEIAYANTHFLKMMGSDESAILGKPFVSTFASGHDNERPLLSEISVEDVSKTFQLRCVRESGDEFDASLLIAPVYGTSGKVEQYFVCYVDSEAASVEQRKLEERTNDQYKHAPGFIAIMRGPLHEFSFVNDAYKALVGQRDLIGKPASLALPELADQGFLPLLDEVYSSGRHVARSRMPVLLKRGVNGTENFRYVDFVYAPIFNSEGAVTGIFSEGSDVTDVELKAHELRLLQSQLIQLSRLNAMGTMAATLAHEINQPLAAIANYASGCRNLLSTTDQNSDVVREGLAAIEAASIRAGDIIRRLRDMTRKTTEEPEAFDLADAVFDCVQLVKAGTFENVRVDTNHAGAGIVRADRVQIQQVIINLLKNACEATADSGQGRVTAVISRKDGVVQLHIGDDGPGVSPAALKTLFEWADSTKAFGMGIGLSICRTIVESQGGSIWLEKTSDKGACFAIALPEALS